MRDKILQLEKKEVSMILELILIELIIKDGDKPIFCSFVGEISLKGKIEFFSK